MFTYSSNDTAIAALQYQIAEYEDAVAYKSLFKILFPALQSFALAIVKQRALAEELASDMMIHVWEKRKTLTQIKNLKLYLFIALRNNAIAAIKKESKNATIPFDDLLVELNSSYPTPLQSVTYLQAEQAVAVAISQLPLQCQLIYKLAKEEKFKYKDIATLLQISVKTIDNQLAIALKKLSIALSAFNGKEINENP